MEVHIFQAGNVRCPLYGVYVQPPFGIAKNGNKSVDHGLDKASPVGLPGHFTFRMDKLRTHHVKIIRCPLRIQPPRVHPYQPFQARGIFPAHIHRVHGVQKIQPRLIGRSDQALPIAV